MILASRERELFWVMSNDEMLGWVRRRSRGKWIACDNDGLEVGIGSTMLNAASLFERAS